jgi:hypothetical protein
VPISDDMHRVREVAAARELEALQTALAEHYRMRGSHDRTARVLRQMIDDRRRVLSPTRF